MTKPTKYLLVFGVLVLVLAGLFLVHSHLTATKKDLGNGYSTDGSSIFVIDKCRVTFSIDNPDCSYSTKKVAGADFGTFDVLSSPYQGIYGIAKDKNHVYLLGEVMANADATSFENLGNGYLEDKNNIYFVSLDYFDGEKDAASNISSVVGNSSSLPVLAPNDGTFTVYDQYAKNSQHVFYNGQIVAEAETATFHKFNNCFFADKSRIYADDDNGIGQVVDIPTLQQVSGECNYVKDKNFVYDYAGVVQGANPATFSPIASANNTESSFSTDGKNVYLNNQLLAGADPKTFHAIGMGYFADAAHVWYQETGVILLTGVDPKTLNTKYTCNYLTDKNGAYYDYNKFTKLVGSDSATFEVIPDTCFAKDKSQVYHLNQVITGADPASFTVIGNQEYAKDKNHVYKVSDIAVTVVPGADPNTFKAP